MTKGIPNTFEAGLSCELRVRDHSAAGLKAFNARELGQMLGGEGMTGGGGGGLEAVEVRYHPFLNEPRR